MAATLALVRAARREPGLEAALAREYRVASRIIAAGDMLEGVRAQVIDKDRNPQWADTFTGVGAERVAGLMAPLGVEELVLAPAG
jgi:hypothetical protein